MRLPPARGPLSGTILATLLRPPHERVEPLRGALRWLAGVPDEEDLQLALWVCYELHYRGFDGVDDRWEWEPDLLSLRARLEQAFERGLRARVTPPRPVPPARVPEALAQLAAGDAGPPLASYLQRHATLEEFREFVVHRSIYHLKEADPHTWVIPRVAGHTKAALVEIQADEYGGGRAPLMHAELFRRTMRALDLDDTYGAYLDVVPAATLATSNVISLFGLHHRHRGAALGHLAAFEMTSSLPNRRYGNGLRRLGYDEEATRFYDEHVLADAVHEQIAAHDLCGTFVRSEPAAVDDVLFGAACGLALDAGVAAHLLERWRGGASSLRAGNVAAAGDLACS